MRRRESMSACGTGACDRLRDALAVDAVALQAEVHGPARHAEDAGRARHVPLRILQDAQQAGPSRGPYLTSTGAFEHELPRDEEGLAESVHVRLQRGRVEAARGVEVQDGEDGVAHLAVHDG